MHFPSLRHLFRQWYFWLFVITAVAIIIRSLPGWLNPAWGSDFGIYYQLTNTFVKTKELFNPYIGWGGSYQYFPILYAITGAAHWITGIDVLTLLPKIAPIFGGLSIFIFYFIVYDLLGDRKKALLASVFLAVLPFHVYQTSHAAPLTMGHFFLMLSLLFFIRFRKNTRYLAPLLASTVLLIMSHHLTTFFYLLSLISIVFIENAASRVWAQTVKKDMAFIVLTSGLVFSYWIFVAKTVYESFMRNGLRIGSFSLPSNAAIILFYVVFFSLFGIIILKRRFNLFSKAKQPTKKSCLMKFFAAITISLVAMSIFTFVKLPWTNFSFTPLSILFSIPLVLIIGFGVAGFRFTRFIENGNFIRGWIAALLLSFFYALATNSTILPPDRHLEYMMAPLSILAVFGIHGIFSYTHCESRSSWRKNALQIHRFSLKSRTKRLLQKYQIIYVVVILILVASNAVSVYPSYVSLNASYEIITDEDLAALEWMKKNLDHNTSVIAADHRIARMAEADGFNTTLDQAYKIWTAVDIREYLSELKGDNKNYTHITHIVIDDIIKERVVHVYFGEIYYMTNESYDKFLSPPFELLYRNATLNQDGIEQHWVEVYEVNWTFVERISSISFLHRLIP